MICRTFTSIPLLVAVVLRLGATSLDSFGDPAYWVFMTLCEAYMGIEPHFNLWNYFFNVWLWLGSDTELVVWGCADISVRSRPG
jgi:hypothetical protein